MQAEPSPYVIVYQNADFVGSLYQSATNDGLPISSQYEGIDTSDQSHSGAKQGSGGITAKANIPGLSAAEANLAGGLDSTTKNAQTWSRRHQIEMSRDTALYLHMLHDLLGNYTEIVDSSDNAATLNTGALVKFQGRFRPDPIGALLDLSNPDTVAEITRFKVRQASRPTVDEDNWNIEKLKAEWEIAEQEATTKADLARTIAEAVHTDFRRGTTTEFHCRVSE